MAAKFAALLVLITTVGVRAQPDVSYVAPGAPANFYVPDTPQVSIPEVRFPSGSQDLPLDEEPLQRSVSGFQPEQVNLIYISPTEVTATWNTGDYQDGQTSTFTAVDPSSICSTVAYGTAPNNLNQTANGTGTTYNVNYYYSGFSTKQLGCNSPTTCAAGQCDTYNLLPLDNCGPLNNYTSGIIHHTPLQNLKPATTYYYQVGCNQTGLSETYSFRTAQALGPTWTPYRIAMWADVGQTMNSSITLEHMVEANADVSILIGDLTYSDDYLPDGHIQPDNYSNQVPTVDAPSGGQPAVVYEARWDSWYRLMEPLFSSTPWISAAGNHEIESQLEYDPTVPANLGNAGPVDLFKAWNTRYGIAGPAKYTGDDSVPSYFSTNLPGIHLVVLNAYIGNGTSGETDYYIGSGSPLKGDAQYEWLLEDLTTNFNRTLTPWLMVIFHPPWYNSYVGGYYAHECFRQNYESLFYTYGVDIVMHGHIHAYERTDKVYNYSINPCAPYYMTIGDAGNIEGLTAYFVNSTTCQRALTAGGDACAPKTCTPAMYNQPVWSVYREPSFGHIVLNVLNSTAIEMTWHRNQDSENVISDFTVFRRYPQYCTNQAQPSSMVVPQSAAPVGAPTGAPGKDAANSANAPSSAVTG